LSLLVVGNYYLPVTPAAPLMQQEGGGRIQGFPKYLRIFLYEKNCTGIFWYFNYGNLIAF